MKKFLALSGILALTATAAAETYKWVGGENGSWASAESFEPKGNPGAEDTVVLPVSTVALNASDDAQWAAANAIGRIQPDVDSGNADIGSVLIVDVGEKDRDCNFAFTYKANAGRNAGKMIKKLAGFIGGGGGGKADMAQAGGRDPEGIEEAFSAAKDLMK